MLFRSITITRNNVLKRIKNRNNRNITTREYNQYNNISCLINPDNCGYNIVEIYEIYNPVKNYDKTVLWIIPYTQNNNGFGFDNDKYLGDFTYLNASHIPMLETVKRLYQFDDNICFVHMLPSLKFFCLHIHVIKESSYRGAFTEQEKGTGAIREKYIDELINNIKCNSQYYNQLNMAMIKQIGRAHV